MAVNFHDLGGTSADKPYWNALAEGRLEMQRCAKCATWLESTAPTELRRWAVTTAVITIKPSTADIKVTGQTHV